VEVRFLTPARLEFLEALEFYRAQVSGLGAEFLGELERATERLAANPRLGAPYDSETRRLLLRRFPFSLIYEVHADHVLVVAVAHQRRRPGYWHARQTDGS
jgi:toxin ParE1/3/4